MGGKGAVPWPAAKNFAHMICAQMAQDSPTKYLDTMAKKDRLGRIFLDYLRNDRTSTAVAVLSSRARAGATISMPIHWRDVNAALDPTRYTVRTGAAILAKSKPWEGYRQATRSLASAIRQGANRPGIGSTSAKSRPSAGKKARRRSTPGDHEKILSNS